MKVFIICLILGFSSFSLSSKIFDEKNDDYFHDPPPYNYVKDNLGVVYGSPEITRPIITSNLSSQFSDDYYFNQDNIGQYLVNGNPAEEQTYDFVFTDSDACNGVILVQYNVNPITYANTRIIPYHSLYVINCDSSKKVKMHASVNYINTKIKNFAGNNILDAILIPANELSPNKMISINGYSFTVISDDESTNIIVSLNQWINIQDKANFKEESGVFSMFTENYEEYFMDYTSSLPFSRNILLQMIPLGSVNGNSEITSQDKSLSSNFIDYIWCKDRYCDGGKFDGNKHGGFAFQGEEHNDFPILAVSYLFENVEYNLKESSYKNSDRNRHVRTLISQSAEYQDGIVHTCCFAYNPSGAWVGLLPHTLIEGDTNNELPHELGHTYDLPDYSGYNTKRFKYLPYRTNVDGTIKLPYNTDLVYYRGSMSGGNGYDYFTQLTAFDTSVIELAMSSAKKIDDRIQINPNENLESTILISPNNNDVLAFRINAYIPSYIEQYAGVIENDGDLVIVRSYDANNNFIKEIKYNRDNNYNRVVVLPKDFYPNDGYITVVRGKTHVNRKFFIRDDAKKLVPAYINTDNISDLKMLYIIETATELSQLTNDPNYLQSIYDQGYKIIMVKNSKNEHINNFKLSILSPQDTDKQLQIYNTNTQPLDIIKETTTTTVHPNYYADFMFTSGWSLYTGEANTKTLTVSDSQLQQFYETPLVLNELYKDYDNIVVETWNGRWYRNFYLELLDEQYISKVTIVFICYSSYGFNVNIKGVGTYTLEQGDSRIFKLNEPWTNDIYYIGDDENATPSQFYNLTAKETNSASNDNGKLLTQLYNTYEVIYSNFDSNLDFINFNLVELTNVQDIGKEFQITKTIDDLITVKTAARTINLDLTGIYTFLFRSPWNKVSSVPKEDFIIDDLDTIEKLVLDPDYIYTFLDTYDNILIICSDGNWVSSLEFLPNQHAYKYIDKTVTVQVESTWSVSVLVGLINHNIHYSDKISIKLNAGWTLWYYSFQP